MKKILAISRTNDKKIFTAVIHECLVIRLFFHGKPFQSSLTFVDKAGV
jgi:hypothetical protein